MYWGSPAQVGSLCNIRELVRWMKVDKAAKVFNVCDEFIVHAYKSHLLAAVCTQLMKAWVPWLIAHESTLQWSEAKAKEIVSQILYWSDFTDPVYGLHHTYLHIAFLYVDLRNAIQFEEGEHIIRH